MHVMKNQNVITDPHALLRFFENRIPSSVMYPEKGDEFYYLSLIQSNFLAFERQCAKWDALLGKILLE